MRIHAAKELEVLIESLRNIAGDNARVLHRTTRDGQSSYKEVYASIERIGDQRDEEIVLILTW